MRHVLGSTTARLAEWTIAPLPYLSILRGRMLARLNSAVALTLRAVGGLTTRRLHARSWSRPRR